MRTNPWNKRQIATLIKGYESEPCLYMKTHKYYHSRDHRASAIRRICESLSKVRPNTTEKECAYKFTILRNTFNWELKKVKKSMKSGVGVKDIYKSKLWFYNSMKFIERFVITRRSYSSELKQMEAKKKDLAITTPDHSVNVIKAEDSDQNQDIISVSSEEDAMPPAETKPLLISDATLKETNGEKNGTKRIIVDEYSKLLETIVRLNSQSISIMAPEESIQEGTNSAMADACGVFVSQMLQRFKNESAQVGTIVEIIRILGEGLKKDLNQFVR